MSRLKRLTELVILFVGLPFAILFLAGVPVAVGVESLLIYSGSLLAAWTLSAVALPILFGAMSPREIVDGYQSRRRHEAFYEGEPLRATRDRRAFWRRSRRPRPQFYPLEAQSRPREGFAFWAGRFTTD